MIKKITLNLLYSYISVLGLSFFLSLSSNSNLYFSNNFIFLIIFLLYFLFIRKLNLKFNKKLFIFSLFFSIILAFILSIGQVLELNTIRPSILKLIIIIIGLTTFFLPISTKLFDLNLELNSKQKYNDIKNSKKKYMFVFIIIWIFGFLGWLALYPGGYDYDAPVQLRQFMNSDYSVTTHFSVLFSYLEYLIISLGHNIFNNYQAAISLFTFLQMTVVSAITTYICIFISKNIKNKFLFYICIAFYCLFPFHILLQVSCVQDTLFACSMAIFIISLYKLSNNNDFFKSKLNIITFIISGILLCLFRNNGIYIIIITIIMILLIKFVFKVGIPTLKTNACFLSIIIFYYLYSLVLLPSLGVKSTDTIKEMSSIPSQQLIRVHNNNISAFSKEELNKLNKFYPNCDFSIYNINELISDQQKACLNEEYTKENLLEYISLYVSIGLKDPVNYIKAFLLNTYGFWYPNKSYPDYRMYHPYIEYEVSTPSLYSKDLIEIERESKFPIYEKALNYILNQNNWQKVPVISSICSMGTYFIIILFAFFLVIYKKKYNLLIPISIYIGIYVTLFLSPVALYRYCYSVMLSLPLIILIIAKVYENKNNKIKNT